MLHDVHHATFAYNYVNRAVWGEKSCRTPLQDLDELHAKSIKSMAYATVNRDKNNSGYISRISWEMGIMLSFIEKYDKQWLESDEWDFTHYRRSAPGISAEKYLLFKKSSIIKGIDLMVGYISLKTDEPNTWHQITAFDNFGDFVHYHDYYMSVCGRFNQLLVEQSTKSLGDNISKCRKLFDIVDGVLLSEARHHTLEDWREVFEMAMDLYLGITDSTIDDLQFEVRQSCHTEEASPLRLLCMEVINSVENSQKEIL